MSKFIVLIKKQLLLIQTKNINFNYMNNGTPI